MRGLRKVEREAEPVGPRSQRPWLDPGPDGAAGRALGTKRRGEGRKDQRDSLDPKASPRHRPAAGSAPRAARAASAALKPPAQSFSVGAAHLDGPSHPNCAGFTAEKAPAPFPRTAPDCSVLCCHHLAPVPRSFQGSSRCFGAQRSPALGGVFHSVLVSLSLQPPAQHQTFTLRL